MGRDAVDLICRECLGIAPTDRFVLLGATEPFLSRMAGLIAAAGGAVCTLPRKAGAALPPAPLPGRVLAEGRLIPADKAVVEPGGGLTYADTLRLRQWRMQGLRYALLESSSGALVADYPALRRRNAWVADRLTGGHDVQIADSRGTRLWLNISARQVFREDCCFSAAEPVFQLPGGEVFVAPHEDRARGVLALDLALHGLPGGGTALVTVEKGVLAGLRVPDRPEVTRAVGEMLGIGRERVGELGFGTNPNARMDGSPAESEKALGSIHIGIGENRELGGRNRSAIHRDLLLPSPTVWIDGRLLMRAGRFEGGEADGTDRIRGDGTPL